MISSTDGIDIRTLEDEQVKKQCSTSKTKLKATKDNSETYFGLSAIGRIGDIYVTGPHTGVIVHFD